MKTLTYLPDSLAWVKVSGASWQGDSFLSRYPHTGKRKELSKEWEPPGILSQKQALHGKLINWYMKIRLTHSVFIPYSLMKRNAMFSFHRRQRQDQRRVNTLWYYDSEINWSDIQTHHQRNRWLQLYLRGKTGGRFWSPPMMVQRTAASSPWIQTLNLLHGKPSSRRKQKTFHRQFSRGKLFISYLKNVTSRVYIYMIWKANWNLGSHASFSICRRLLAVRWKTKKSSHLCSITFPPTIYRYDIATGKNTIFRKPEVKIQTRRLCNGAGVLYIKGWHQGSDVHYV